MFTKFFTCLLTGAALLLLAALPVRADNFTAGNADELVAAVAAANANIEVDTITLTGSPTIALTVPLLIKGDLTIKGPGTLSITGMDAVLEIMNCTVTLDTLTFQDCITSIGVVYVSDGTLTATDCSFLDNLANTIGYYSGGAISSDYSDITLTNSTFTGNTTDVSAGAVAINGGSLTASGCTFTANASPYESMWGGLAGAISAIWCPVTLTDCTFSANTSMSTGGALACSDGYVDLLRCTFTDNSASFLGGALLLVTPGMTAVDCTFIGNRSFIGGAICYQSVYDEFEEENYFMWLSGCVFHDNSVEGKVLPDMPNPFTGGGAIFAAGDAIALNCRFTNNRAHFTCAADDTTVEASGGAVLSAGTFAAANCAFSANNVTSANNSSFGAAQASGGAISTFMNSYYDVYLINSTLSGNTANASAPGFEMADAIGGGITLAGNAALVNSILWGNLANGTPNQTEYEVGDWPAPYVSNCDIQDNPGGIWVGTGNIDADPCFTANPGPGVDGIWGTADDDAGDLTLTAGSPCIDAGSNDAFDPEFLALDLAGNPRIVHDIVDMGAYEYQLDPAQEAIIDLQQAVQVLVDSGVQLPADGKSLQDKLQNALTFLAAGDLVNARGAIGAFINQVQAFLKTGKLTQAQANALIAEANAILPLLQ